MSKEFHFEDRLETLGDEIRQAEKMLQETGETVSNPNLFFRELALQYADTYLKAQYRLARAQSQVAMFTGWKDSAAIDRFERMKTLKYDWYDKGELFPLKQHMTEYAKLLRFEAAMPPRKDRGKVVLLQYAEGYDQLEVLIPVFDPRLTGRLPEGPLTGIGFPRYTGML